MVDRKGEKHMKFSKKHIALLMSLALLSGCTTSSIKVTDGKNAVITGTNSSVTATTLQSLYNKLYTQNGTLQASREIIDQVAQLVLTEAFGSSVNAEAKVAERVKEFFDTYYTSTYKVDGYFDENLLVTDLRKQGYNITGNNRFIETYSDISNPNYKYEKLKDNLQADYSDLIARKFNYDARLQLLNEQYILSQKASHFSSTRIRKVEYVALPTTGVDSDDTTLLAQYEAKLNQYISTDDYDSFKALVVEIESIYNEYKLKKLAEDFAIINYKAQAMTLMDKTYAGNDPYDYLAKSYEYDYMNKYINIYDSAKRYKQVPTFTCTPNCVVTVAYVEDILGNYESTDGVTFNAVTPYLSSEVDAVKSKITSYSSSGTQSIYVGYETRQLNIMNSKYYTEKVGLNTTSFGTTITTDIDTQVFKTWGDVKLATVSIGGTDYPTQFLDFSGTNKAIFKNNGTYYIVKVTNINADSDAALKAEGAKSLATISANVKDALKYYFGEYNLSIHEEDLYTYLNTNYGYTID